MRCMVCLTKLNAYTGWLRNPDGVTCCWPCYLEGLMPSFPWDVYADEPEAAPVKRKPRTKKEMDAVWD